MFEPSINNIFFIVHLLSRSSLPVSFYHSRGEMKKIPIVPDGYSVRNLFQIIDDILDTFDLGRLGVVDLDVEFLLDGHDQFHRVQ